MIKITENISIREDELFFKVSRSSGPGGQNVNKVSTKVTLLFDVASCESFSNEQKKQILARLASRTNKQGVIRIVSQKFRTQIANRNSATQRLQVLLREALKRKPIRKKTNVPEYARKRRLEEKRRRSLLKKQRAKSDWTEDFAE